MLSLASQNGDMLITQLARRDVARKAASVDKLITLPQNVGTNEYVADGTVFAEHSCFVILDRLALAQPLKNVFDHRLVHMKFSNVMANVFFAGEAEHFHLGAI